MILSILICSLESRRDVFNILLEHLGSQCRSGVEILANVDNKEKTTGKKRNELLKQAEGKYVVFIDDDDMVPDYYVEEMLRGCASGADCVAINGIITTDGTDEIKWRLSKDYENVTVKENGKDIYLRKTNHITAVKRDLALRSPFPDKSNAEDKWYSDNLNQFLKTEFKIEMPMYHYRYSSHNKEYK